MGPQDLDPARRRAPRSERSALWHANATLARPIAVLFGLLGVAPGQLSLQSLWLTLVGILRMASGDWAHVTQGALVVYLGLLFDRADHLLAAEAGGQLPAWATFLGLLVDRLVDAALVVGLAVLVAVGVQGTPGWLGSPWRFLAASDALVLAALTLGVLLVGRLATAYADVLYLRTHLLVVRRPPGPSLLPRRPQGAEILTRLGDRDLLVLAWAAGVLLAQVQVVLVLLLAVHLAVLAEAVVLFWHRRKDPEPQASRILARNYP